MVVLSDSCRDEPISLFVVHRHSIRAPVFYPPGDSTYICRDNFPRGPSYLTDVGIKRAVQVGTCNLSLYCASNKSSTRDEPVFCTHVAFILTGDTL
ncbi:hypothetical protein BIW11_07618 [Tropilaelaps mercedesae]|uniref:Uncharacterized protein n=1 Tax=Tropilaelaps mercedesae TaxID=418985 RepID=A0A1V9XTC3_9ACAR|nr:hypothetical protein BIW11_07618 [Tropilaelaps mercedesae]